MSKTLSRGRNSTVAPQAEPLGDSAYRSIRAQILEKAFKPGEALSEAVLAQELGMSRTPIREALKRLEQEGLVTSVPKKGFFVDSMSPADLSEVYDMREVIEGLAARLLARRVTPEQADILKDLAAAADAPSSTINDEAAFHSAVVDMCGNHRVVEAVRVFCLHVFTYDERMHRLTSSREAHIAGEGRATDAHCVLVEKIISGSAAEAEELARKHVRLGRSVAAKFLLEIFD